MPFLDETTHNPIVETEKTLSSFQEPKKQAYRTYVKTVEEEKGDSPPNLYI